MLMVPSSNNRNVLFDRVDACSGTDEVHGDKLPFDCMEQFKKALNLVFFCFDSCEFMYGKSNRTFVSLNDRRKILLKVFIKFLLFGISSF